MFKEYVTLKSEEGKTPYEQRDESEESVMRQELEEQEPGIVDHLKREYNIEHFARYPQDVLLDMYKDRNSAEPWGVTIVAKEDHNGASYHSKALHEMHQEIGSSIRTKVIEVSSVDDVIELTTKLGKKFGKASYAIVEAHGHEGGFNLGKETEDPLKIFSKSEEKKETPTVDTNMAIEEFSGALAEHLFPDAGVCFVSCSTGKHSNSVAPQIASKSNLETVAPTDSTNISSFGAEIRGRVVKFNPDYYEGTSRRTKGGEKVDKLPEAA